MPKGLSWYGDSPTARRLSIDLARLRRARGDLVRAGLLAYARPLYQVLALGEPLRKPTTPPHAVASNEAAPRIVAAPQRVVAREHLTALRAVLGKRA